MSAISSFGGASSPETSSASGFSALSSEEFVKIIFAELTNQDPLEPNDSKALIDQLASLRSIESDIALTENLNNLVKQTEFASAASLVGQVVGGLTLNGDRVLDLVVSVSNTAEHGAVLNLFDGEKIPFSFVEEILGPLGDPEPTPDLPGDDEVDDEGDAPGGDDSGGPPSGSTSSDDAETNTSDPADSEDERPTPVGGTGG